jgi:hypothetical protein
MFVILFIEHYCFRGGNFAKYDLEGWNTLSRLSIGLAGGFAFLCGWAGAILGMDETCMLTFPSSTHPRADIKAVILDTLHPRSVITEEILETSWHLFSLLYRSTQ